MLEFFSRVFGEVFLFIRGFEHALIFKDLFLGCQHGIGERVSLREAVSLIYRRDTKMSEEAVGQFLYLVWRDCISGDIELGSRG